MRTIHHPLTPAAQQLQLTLTDEWKESVDDEMLTLTRGEAGLGTLQLSLAPHLYRPGLMPPHLMELAEKFALAKADGPAVEQRTWRRADVVVGSAAAPHGDWWVHCFVVQQREAMVFGTYVCRRADSPGELKAVEDILQTLDVHPPAEVAA